MTPWNVACQAPLFMAFPRQEYWSKLPFPSPRDLPDPGTEAMSSALAGRFFTTEPLGKTRNERDDAKWGIASGTLLQSLIATCCAILNDVWYVAQCRHLFVK